MVTKNKAKAEKPVEIKKPEKAVEKAIEKRPEIKSEKDLAKELISTGVRIQAKSVDLISAMDNLTKRIDKLVNLFEEASKHVTEAETTEQRINELTVKLESLLEQNKTIAKGLILLEKYVRGKTEFTTPRGEKIQEYSGV